MQHRLFFISFAICRIEYKFKTKIQFQVTTGRKKFIKMVRRLSVCEDAP
jgi:hypothetical protein